jgi:hypothetical protein
MIPQILQRTRTRTRTSLVVVVVLLCVAASRNVSHAWVPSTKTGISSNTLQPFQVRVYHRSGNVNGNGYGYGYGYGYGSNSAKFYKRESSTILSEDAALTAAKAVASDTVTFQQPSSKYTSTSTCTPAQSQTQSLSKIRQLPWMQEDGPDADASKNVFVDLWNWQFEFFEEHLTNLQVRDVKVQHPDDVSIHDLYYATKGSGGGGGGDTHKEQQQNKPQKQQRVYTISLESDEYRDIRMTYMHCPGMQTFRCLSYPNNGDIPIMGMGIMKMGGSKHLAILDYQPLPPTKTTATETNQNQKLINDTYTKELLKLRQEIPSMSQPMTRRHFDSNEERKYFTEFPMLGRCNELEATETEVQDYRNNLSAAQKKYVAKHIELTQTFDKKSSSNSNSNNNKTNDNSKSNNNKEDDDLSYVLERHSDFDTHVSEKEPAGPFLCSVFGPEIGGKLVHNVIFPLSQHGLSGHLANAKTESSPSS